MRMHQIVLFFSLLLTSCGIDSAEDSKPSALVYNRGRWANPRLIPVCVVNRGEVRDGLFNDVTNHVKREYAARAGIGLVGFNQCTGQDYGNNVIRVFFAKVWDWGAPGAPAGGGLSMVGPTAASCGGSCAGGTMRLDIGRSGDYPGGDPVWIRNNTRSAAVHEFGHALGLLHEHERTDANGCTPNPTKIPAGGDNVYVGPYDPNSIMSYCHPGDQTGLTNGDVEGLQWLYPVTRDLGGSVPIRVDLSGKCVEIDGHSFDPAAKIQQWDCTGQRNQLWRLRDVGGGLFEIRSANTDLCLDVDKQSRDNGAKVIQWFCNGTDNQKVRILDRGNGRRSFQFAHSGRCLDIDASRLDNGVHLQQWDCLGNPAQSFFH